MNETSGIFKVIDCNMGDNAILGTAFALKTFYNVSKYYLLTAYHVISELEAKQRPIVVSDEYGRTYSAIKVFPKKLSRTYREFGQDYALLEIYSEIDYKTYEIAIIDSHRECFIRGTIPYYDTVFSSIDGKILGQENIPHQKQVLQISLNTHLIFDKENKAIPEQTILKGLSGAPVFVEMENEMVCVGVLGNLARDMRGSFKYAVPMKTIIDDCLLKLNISYRLYNEKEKKNIAFHDDAIVELILGEPDSFLFTEEKLEQEAWGKLSDLFYKGNPVDCYLENLIHSDNFNEYNEEVKCAFLYFYARLLFKRGKCRLAFGVFNEISKMYSKVSEGTKIKVKTLINSRTAIEQSIESPNKTLKLIRYAGEKVSNIPNASNEYISYELASMYGRGLTNLFSINTDYSFEEKEDIFQIYNDHTYLLKKNPIKLCKQDVVNTSLKWYIGFWGVNKQFDLENLNDSVYEGFFQSRQRKNNIFYIQSMMAYGILAALNDKMIQAIKMLLLSVKIMHKEKVDLTHEGIRQLLLFLKEKFLALYAVVELAYKTQLNSQFINKVSLYQIDIKNYSWQIIVDQVDELYELKFFNNKRIYNINIEDIEIFLI